MQIQEECGTPAARSVADIKDKVKQLMRNGQKVNAQRRRKIVASRVNPPPFPMSISFTCRMVGSRPLFTLARQMPPHPLAHLLPNKALCLQIWLKFTAALQQETGPTLRRRTTTTTKRTLSNGWTNMPSLLAAVGRTGRCSTGSSKMSLPCLDANHQRQAPAGPQRATPTRRPSTLPFLTAVSASCCSGKMADCASHECRGRGDAGGSCLTGFTDCSLWGRCWCFAALQEGTSVCSTGSDQ